MQLKKYFILPGLILLVVVLLTACQSTGQKLNGSTVKQDNVEPVNTAMFKSQVNDEGGVTITVSPQDLSRNASSWDFEIVLSTHSVDLGQDLLQVAILTDNTGAIYAPIAWTGSEPGGHHREGILRFPLVTEDASWIELKIADVGAIAERIFKWEL